MVAPLTTVAPEPIMPDRFAGTPGEAKWHLLIGDLRTRGVPICQVDADRIGEYVDAFLSYRHATEQLAREELVLVTPTGQRRVNPLIDVRKRTQQVMLAVSRQYGFDPLSRQRLKADVPKSKVNKFAFVRGAPTGPRVVNGVTIPAPPTGPIR